eukprot:EST49265.1 Hypothetical protein SS50377_10486 [Spironucleus salmonicida]
MLYQKFANTITNIFQQLNLHPPYDMTSFYVQLKEKSLSHQLYQQLAKYSVKITQFDEFEFPQFLQKLDPNKSPQQIFQFYHELSLKLQRFFISHGQLQKFYPQTFTDILKYLRIVGLDNANRFLPQIHTGAIQMASSFGLNIEKLIQYVQAIENCYGEKPTFAETLWFSCKKQLIKKYNSYGIFLALEQANQVYELANEIRARKQFEYSHFIVIQDLLLRKCNCFYIYQITKICPICFHQKLQKSLFLNFAPSHFPIIMKLFQEIRSKNKLFYCKNLEDLQQIIKSCQIMYKQRSFVDYVLGLDSYQQDEFLSHIQDICLQLISSPYINDRMKIQNFDQRFIELIHEFYCLSWIQLFYLQQSCNSKESLAYFLTRTKQSIDIQSANTDDFQILVK